MAANTHWSTYKFPIQKKSAGKIKKKTKKRDFASKNSLIQSLISKKS